MLNVNDAVYVVIETSEWQPKIVLRGFISRLHDDKVEIRDFDIRDKACYYWISRNVVVKADKLGKLPAA